ncbi:MAG: type II secretion system protein [Acidimicrobiia bacterium]|nr:type II secretion system protein [Acidimicrobiia bacterium]
MPGRRNERGVALVELLIAVSILGICSVALLAGLGTVIRTSADHRESADANVVLVDTAESIKAAPFTAPCDPTGTAYLAYAASHTTLPNGWSYDDVAVSVDCGPLDEQEQGVEITVSASDGATFELVVAKAQSSAGAAEPAPTSPPAGA